jgi:hypothetical protein
MTAKEQRYWQVFVAYAGVDRPWARCLAENLHRLGVDVFYDDWEIAAGDVFVAKVDEGLAHSHAGVIVVSPEALSHPWVGESYAAILNAAAQRRGKLIPVILREARLPPMLASRHPIDFTGLSGARYEERVRELAFAIRGRRPSRPKRGEPLQQPPPLAGVRSVDDERLRARFLAALREVRAAVEIPSSPPADDVGSQLTTEAAVLGVGALGEIWGMSSVAKKWARAGLRVERRARASMAKRRRHTKARQAASSLDKAIEKHGAAFNYADIKAWRARAQQIKCYQRAETIARHLVQLLDEIEERLELN